MNTIKDILKHKRNDIDIEITGTSRSLSGDYLGHFFSNIFNGTYEDLKKYGKQLLSLDVVNYDVDEEYKTFYISVNCPGVVVSVPADKYEKIKSLIDEIYSGIDKWKELDSILPFNIASHFEYGNLYFTLKSCYGCGVVITKK